MCIITNRILNLIFYEASLKRTDQEMVLALDSQLRNYTSTFSIFLGLGRVDYLAMIHGSPNEHMFLTFPNVRSVSTLKCYGLKDMADYGRQTRPSALLALTCLKINPRMLLKEGLSPVTGIIIPRIQRLLGGFEPDELTADIYCTLGWPELALLTSFREYADMLRFVAGLRNLSDESSAEMEPFFSTSFSHLFLRCKTVQDGFELDGYLGTAPVDAQIRAICRPGGHIELLKSLKPHNPTLLLGKLDLSFELRSKSIGELEDILLGFRSKNKELIYATTTDLHVGPETLLG